MRGQTVLESTFGDLFWPAPFSFAPLIYLTNVLAALRPSQTDLLEIFK